MPWSPKAAILLTAQTMSCWRPQIELVVPKRMSGLTGSSGLWETAPDALDDPATLAAAVMLDAASAEERNSRRLIPGSIAFMGRSFDQPSYIQAGPRDRPRWPWHRLSSLCWRLPGDLLIPKPSQTNTGRNARATRYWAATKYTFRSTVFVAADRKSVV